MSTSIVCADDENEYRAILTSIVEREGYSCKTAADGNAAWDLIQQERPDLIILDWSMPGRTGLEVVRAIREDLSLAGRYVILLTGLSDISQKIQALEAGADDYITKPFNTKDLVARIRVGMRARGTLKLLTDEIQLMHRAIEQSPTGIMFTDADGTIQYMNPKSETITGRRKSETLGKNLRAVRRSDSTQSDVEGMWQAVVSGKEWHGTSKRSLTSDKAMWQRTVLSPLMNNEGQISHWLVVDEDITARMHMEEALVRSEALFRSIWDTSIVGLRLTDADGRVLRANEAYCKIVGKQKSEIEGHFFSEAYASESGILEKHRVRFANRSISPQLERRMVLWNGKAVWVELSNSFVELGDQGTILLSIYRDVTERKAAEGELASERELLLTLIDNLPDRVYVKDAEARFLINNMPHVRALGETTRQAVVGKTDFDFRPHEVAAKSNADDQHVIATGEPLINREEQIVSRSGRSATILTTKVPYRDQDGKIKGLVGIGRDITELKRMQGTLVQADKMASLGALTAGIAHEINNPLAYVSSNMNRLEEYFADATALLEQWQSLGKSLAHAPDGIGAELAKLDEHALRIDLEFILQDFPAMITSIRDGIQRIKKIVDGLRGFAHTTQHAFSDANINDAIEETLTVVWNELKYKAAIVKKFSVVPPVKCNIGEIKQVLVNLLVNAAHAIEGMGTITITTKADTDNVLVAIRDTGCGIPSANLKRIFDPFFTTKSVGRGTGLGLWISSTIIGKHNGSLTVESTVGSGTQFLISLPLKQPSDGKDPS